jgi:6-phosphogluconolactonase
MKKNIRSQEDILQTIKQYSDTIFKVAISYTKDKSTSEDILQDVLIKYMTDPTDFHEEEHKKAWLIHVTINECKKFYYSLWNVRRIPLEDIYPFNDPENNGNMVKKALFEPLMIPDANIFYINTAVPPNESAKKYAQRILSYFKNNPVRFDLILLGLGDNAHTASLFPHTPVLKEKKALVKEVYLEDQQSYRITMTAALINEAHAIAFLVYGEAKANAVHDVLEEEKDFETYPAQLIIPEEGIINWFLDEAAANNLIRKEY